MCIWNNRGGKLNAVGGAAQIPITRTRGTVTSKCQVFQFTNCKCMAKVTPTCIYYITKTRYFFNARWSNKRRSLSNRKIHPLPSFIITGFSSKLFQKALIKVLNCGSPPFTRECPLKQESQATT